METEMEPFTNDEQLLLRFQKAKIRYEGAFSLERDCTEFEREYRLALRALGDFEDPMLKDLAMHARDAGKHATDAQQELMELSRRVKDLFPFVSTRIH